jgi:hypothetical protein
MRFNGVLAAPGFEQWFEGTPLDPSGLLYTPEGRPRVAIFSIAHLGDAERMFFVTLLLNQVVGWMRGQSGTSSLRAVAVHGRDRRLLSAGRQSAFEGSAAHAAEAGARLRPWGRARDAEPGGPRLQGPRNAGTWLLGRLQTERDKARVLDGLQGAAAGALDRAEADRILSALGKRVFLLHNVHAQAPVVFHTRWALSYLRGPLTREQIRSLTAGRPPALRVTRRWRPPPRPHRPPRLRQPRCRWPLGRPARPAAWHPAVLPPAQFPDRGHRVLARRARRGARDVHRREAGIDEARDVVYAAPVAMVRCRSTGRRLRRSTTRAGDLLQQPETADAAWLPTPAAAAQAEELRRLAEGVCGLADADRSGSNCCVTRPRLTSTRTSRSATSVSACRTRPVPSRDAQVDSSGRSTPRRRPRSSSGCGAPKRPSTAKRTRPPSRRCRRRSRWGRRSSAPSSGARPSAPGRLAAPRRPRAGWDAA